MPKQNLEFILGKDSEEPSSRVFAFYEEGGKKIAQRFYLNNLYIRGSRFGEESPLSFSGRFDERGKETFTSLETLIKICKHGNFELIKVENEDQIYNAFENRAHNFIRYLLKHYYRNFKDAKIQLSTNWEDLKRKKY